MDSNLLDMILLSEKRIYILLLLKEGSQSIEEILEKLEVSRTAILPQIKKLKEENLVIHENKMYKLSVIGKIIVGKTKPLLDTLVVFEKDRNFWADRKLAPIPTNLTKRIRELGDYRLIEPDISNTFDINPEFVKELSNSSCINIFLSYFHPQFPAFFFNLARKGIKISFTLSEAIYLRFEEDFKMEGNEFLNMENTSIFIQDKIGIEIPAIISATDRVMILGLFNGNGKFDSQCVISFDREAIKWGEDLYKYYRDMSREIKVK
jgi:predicted transcriptional regulator